MDWVALVATGSMLGIWVIAYMIAHVGDAIVRELSLGRLAREKRLPP